MAKVRVEYTIKAIQYIDWPDNEMDNFNEDNLFCNLEPDNETTSLEVVEIIDVEVNEESHYFD